MPKRKTTEQFIQEAIAKHGNKYDYSHTDYKSAQSKVCIICPEHGEFWQTPNSHLSGRGCPKCANNIKFDNNQFIEKAKQVHGNKYDYSSTEYENANSKVNIICPIHGLFEQVASSHLHGHGCPKCGGQASGDTFRITTEQFIIRAQNVHGNKYDYSQVEYTNNSTNVKIICPKHGLFEQQPYHHLNGCGCPRCSGVAKLTTEEFIERAEEIHKNKYDYSETEYVNYTSRVKIICPKHGEFWQRPSDHLFGKGCLKCAVIQRNLTKQQNGTFNTSQPEENLYKLLCNKFGVDDVFRQYRDETRYPFNCDFYIKSQDLFIELNANWTHQGHFYDENNPDDINHYHELLEKYPDWGWDNWIKRDPLKRDTAIKNNLNYKVFWDNDLSDAKQWLNSI